jgi:hypothetical protein
MEPFALADRSVEYDLAQTVNVKAYFPTGTFYWDLKQAQNCEITLTSNLTMGAPQNWKKGRLVMVEFIQDATGSRTVAWNSAFKNSAVISIVATAANSTICVFKCIDNGGVEFVSQNNSTRS